MISSLVTEPQSRPKPLSAPTAGVLRRDLVGATIALALLTVFGFLLFGADVVLDARTEQLRNQAVAYVRATDASAASLLAARFRQNRQLNQASRWVSLVAALIPALGILVFLTRLSRRDRELSLESGRGRRLLTEKTRALERVDAELAQAIAEAQRTHVTLSGETHDKEFTVSLLEAAMLSVPMGIALLAPDLRFIRVNSAFGEIHGKPPEWFVGKAVTEAVPVIAKIATPRFTSVLESGKPLRNVASTGGAYDELGPNKHWRSSYFPIRDARSNIIGVGVTLEDVTEHSAIAEQFHHAQKMEAVARLASGVAHDFNNLLVIIRCYTDILLLQEGMGEESLSDLHEVRSAADRAAVLSRQLLTFARQDVVAPHAIDVRPRLRELQDMLTRIIPKELTLTVVVPEALDQVQIDPGHLDQILMNLAVNSVDAMPTGGRLTLTAARLDAEEDLSGRVAGAPAGAYVVLTVADTGMGMDKATRSRIFEPFFTTKSADKGTGLGLSTVYALVRQYSGFLQVESEPDQGTTFRIYFPVASGLDDPTQGPSIHAVTTYPPSPNLVASP